VRIGWIIYLVSFVLGSRPPAMGVGLMLKIRCFHSFYLLILSLYLPLVMVFVVVIWLLVWELVTTMGRMGRKWGTMMRYDTK